MYRDDIDIELRILRRQYHCLLRQVNGMVTTFPRVATYSVLPPAADNCDQYYVVENSQGISWIPFNFFGTYYPKGIYYSDCVTWHYAGDFPYQASQADVNAGIINSQFITPLTLKNSTQWNTKANTSHTHTASNVTDFQTAVSANTDVAANTLKLLGIEDGAEVNDDVNDSFGIAVGSEDDITVGYKCPGRVKSDLVIYAYRLESFEKDTNNPVSGDIDIDIEVNGSSIGTASLSSASTTYDNVLVGWTVSLTKESKVQYNVTYCSGIKNILLTIYYVHA